MICKSRRPEILAQAGWKEAQFRDFHHWLFFDEEQYSQERLLVLLNTGGDLEIASISDKVLGVYRESRDAILFLLSTLLLALFFSAGKARLASGGFWVLATQVGFFLLVAFMAVSLRFPSRIAGPICYFLGISNLLIVFFWEQQSVCINKNGHRRSLLSLC